MYPALSVVAALGDGHRMLWVGGQDSMEADLVPRAGIPFEAVPAAGIHGVGLIALPGNLARLARGVMAARRIIADFRPDVLFFTGGYVGVPVAIGGRRIPKVVYVPDIEPGLALRFIGRLSTSIAVTAEDTRRHFPSGKRVEVTGYPTRPELQRVDPAQARERLGLEADLPVVLVFGGSRGARSINQALWGELPVLLEAAQVLHITGELDWPRIEQERGALEGALAERYHPFSYLHREMGDALAVADLAVSRAGASSLGEFPLFGLPAILVPYPHAWRYQRINADYMVGKGAALRLEDEELGEKLVLTVLSLLNDRDRLKGMARASRELARPQAASSIAAEVIRVGRAGGGAHG